MTGGGETVEKKTVTRMCMKDSYMLEGSYLIKQVLLLSLTNYTGLSRHRTRETKLQRDKTDLRDY